MGGKRETLVGSGKGQVRIHESNGMVHFHNDTEKIKAEVPVAEFHTAWDGIKAGKKSSWKAADVARGTTVSIESVTGSRLRDVVVSVRQDRQDGPDFAALDKFVCPA